MDALYFDLDGTLVEFDTSFPAIYRDAFTDLDADPGDPGEFGRALGDAFRAGADDPFAAAVAETAVDVDPTAFAEVFAATEVEHTVAVPGAAATLESLAGDYRLGVLTNGHGPLQRAKLDALDLSSALDAVVVSGEVGARKPAPEIYAAAEDRLPADGYAFVADDLERDLRPAPDSWRTVWVAADAPDSPTDAQHVTAIEDVRDIL